MLTSIFDNLCDPGEPNTDSANITYVPNLNFNGTDRFTFSVIDGNGDDISTIKVVINVVNDAPSFTIPTPNLIISVDEDSGVSGFHQVIEWATNISTGATNEDQDLTFILSPSPNDLFIVQPKVSSNGTLTYTLRPDANGEVTIDVELQDSGGGLDTSAKQPFTITVIPVNDTPSFTIPTPNLIISVDEDSGVSGFHQVIEWATNISTGATNEDQDLTFILSPSPNDLFIVQPKVSSNGTLTYTLRPDANGEVTIDVELQDSGGGLDTSAKQPFTITVIPVNDTPSFTIPTPNQSVVGINDSGPQIVTDWATNISAGAANEAQGLTFNLSTNALFSVQPTVSSTGTLTYTPAPDAKGSATITVELQDNGTGLLKSASQLFTITVIDPFSNGSFEDNPVNANHWVVVSGNIDWLLNSVWVPSDGIRSIDLNGSGPGAINQTFDTVPGTEYTVLFDMAGNTHSIRIYTMKVSAAGQSREYTFDNFGKTTITFDDVLLGPDEISSYSESGLTMTMTNPVNPHAHTSFANTADADGAIMIHGGDGAEQAEFEMDGTTFDLVTFDLSLVLSQTCFR